jgi:hypothetical protein
LTNGFSPLLSPKTKKQRSRPTQNTITMMAATSVAAAVAASQRQTLPPLG